MNRIYWVPLILLVASGSIASAQQSPASRKPPATVNPQSYPAELVRAGQVRFVSECGFCHGRDAAGGETGPDLTRSELVAEDLRGDKIGPVVRSGRVDKGMPAFNLSDQDLSAIVAFIHDQKAREESVAGGRRSVAPEDLQTGNAEAGRRYFNGEGNCSKCHSPTGDLAGIGSRYRGLTLLQRMLYPAGPRLAPPKASVTLPTGEVVNGSLAYIDEFMISLTDAGGSTRSWPAGEVKFTVDNARAAHFEQLGKYSDDDMHNVYAYLQTLQ